MTFTHGPDGHDRFEVLYASDADAAPEPAGAMRFASDFRLDVIEGSGPLTDYLERVAADLNAQPALTLPIPGSHPHTARIAVDREDPDFPHAVRYRLAAFYGLIMPPVARLNG